MIGGRAAREKTTWTPEMWKAQAKRLRGPLAGR
jgi:hypothetical protein